MVWPLQLSQIEDRSPAWLWTSIHLEATLWWLLYVLLTKWCVVRRASMEPSPMKISFKWIVACKGGCQCVGKGETASWLVPCGRMRVELSRTGVSIEGLLLWKQKIPHIERDRPGGLNKGNKNIKVHLASIKSRENGCCHQVSGK